MRVTVVAMALLVVCLSVDAFKVPRKECKGGFFDAKACSCKCNSIGKVSAPIFCYVNNIVCQASGVGLRDGCCEEYTAANNYGLDHIIAQASGYSGSASR